MDFDDFFDHLREDKPVVVTLDDLGQDQVGEYAAIVKIEDPS